MPLVELKTIKPVCDTCGKVGSIWTTIEPGQEVRAIPPGWVSATLPGQSVLDVKRRRIECDECQDKPDPKSKGELPWTSGTL